MHSWSLNCISLDQTMGKLIYPWAIAKHYISYRNVHTVPKNFIYSWVTMAILYSKHYTCLGIYVCISWCVFYRVECPEMSNRLSIRSLFPSFSFLPPVISTSNNALISLSTEWCITFHYQVSKHALFGIGNIIKGDVY